MILQFSFANHRSFGALPDGALHTLSLVAGRKKDHEGHLRTLPGLREKVLPALAIYGANAAGKSSVIDALACLRWHVLDSFQTLKLDAPLALKPHLLRDADRAGPSTFDLEFVLDGVRYRYGFTGQHNQILREWLHAWPRGVRQIWFERVGPDRKAWHRGPYWKGDWQPIVRATRDNALLLSVAAAMNHAESQSLYRWFAAWSLVPTGLLAPKLPPEPQPSPLLDPAHRDRVRALLRAADLGVVDFRVVNPRSGQLRTPAGSGGVPARLRLDPAGAPKELKLLHRSAGGAAPSLLEPEDESDGTRTWVDLIDHVLTAIDKGVPLLIDELAASLHEVFTQQILALFTDPVSNPRNAQLLFTSHHTSLMAGLRQDALVRVEKDYVGASNLVALNEFKMSAEADVQKLYLSNRFGGLPMTGSLRDALAMEPRPRALPQP